MADEFTKAALYGIRAFNEKTKEKVGMMKLIELLNEFETPRSGVVFKSYDDYDGFFYGVDCDGETEIAWSDSLICSKKFGFIEWLVDNVKINRDKVIRKSDFRPIVKNKFGDLLNPTDERELLMLLSISNSPIEDLISYLK